MTKYEFDQKYEELNSKADRNLAQRELLIHLKDLDVFTFEQKELFQKEFNCLTKEFDGIMYRITTITNEFYGIKD